VPEADFAVAGGRASWCRGLLGVALVDA